MARDYYLGFQVRQALDIQHPLPSFFGSKLAGKGMDLIEKNIPAVQGPYRRDPDHRVIFHISHHLGNNLDTFPLQFEVRVGKRLNIGPLSWQVYDAYHFSPVFHFATKLFVDGAC